MMKRLLICFLLFVTCSGMMTVSAQTKAETKLYGKTVAKATVKAYDSFLKKYPASVYAPEVRYARDSVLFSQLDRHDQLAVENFLAGSPMSPMAESARALLASLKKSDLAEEEAAAVFASLSDDLSGRKTAVVSYRNYGLDHIVAVVLPERSEGMLSFITIVRDGDGWKTVRRFEKPSNVQLDGLTPAFFCGKAEFTDNFSTIYLKFEYVNADKDSHKEEFVANLVDLENETLLSSSFYGNSLLQSSASGSYRIEGQSASSLSSGNLASAEEKYLDSVISADSGLVVIAEADAKTDDAIQWWLQKNIGAESNGHLSFGALEEDCSIVSEYRKKGKESSKTFNAALFDIRGYTVICAYSKVHKQYVLVWCEPAARNRNTDRLLNTIYFENDNTLCLFYYHGRKTFKKRVNLSSRTLR